MRWHARIFQSSIRFAFLTLSIGGVVLTPALAQDENESAGFRSTHVFEAGTFGENIDTLNGGLTLSTAVGPKFKVTSSFDYGLMLNYSSKVWDTAYYGNNIVGEPINEVIPTRKGPFGIGFSMHFGRIYRTRQLQEHPGVENYSPPFTSSWIWEDPSGTPHEFFSDPNIDPTRATPPPNLGPGVTIPPGGASGTATPTFTNRMTSDMSYTRISGPSDTYCKPNGDNGTTDQTNCFRVETPDGRVYTLAKRVDCAVPPLGSDPNFRRTYQQVRSDTESYCGWYTTLIEDPSVGSSPFPINLRVAYDERTNFEHLISRVYDSTWDSVGQTGRQIIFHNCEWLQGANPSGSGIVEMCKPGTRSVLDAPAAGATSRLAAATYKIDMPGPGGSTSFNTGTRAVYKFFYEFVTIKLAHDYYETTPLPNCASVPCTPAVIDPVLKLVRVDYPPSLRVGQAQPDEYSLYYGYFNSYTEAALALSFGGNGDYGEVTCRTLPLLRKPGGQAALVTGNACSSSSPGTWARYDYQYGYYYHIKAFISSGPGGSASGDKKGTSGGGVAFNVTGLTRHIVMKTMQNPAGTAATRSWAYFRQAAQYSNPFSVTVTDPFNNDTVYYYHASASSNNPDITGEDPEDGFAPEWNDGLNHRIEYFRGTGPNRTLVRSELQEHDSDQYVTLRGRLMRGKANIRSKRSVTQYNDDGDVESVVTRQQWDGLGHWRVEIESGFDVQTPRTTRSIYQGVGSGMPGAQCGDPWTAASFGIYRTDRLALKEVSDGRRVLSRLEQQYDARGNLVTSIARATPPASIGTGLPSGNLCASARPGDVMTTYTYSTGSGNITGKALSTGRQDDPTYRIAYGWAPATSACGTAGQCAGYLATKTFQVDQFTPGPFKSIDRDRDANTGLIIATRDTAGVQTSYTYDDLGRVTTITPAQEDATTVDYVSLNETTTTQGTRTTDLDPNADFVFERYRYDGLGQLLATEKRPTDPTRGYVCEKSQFDIGGHLVYRTEPAYATSCGVLPTPPQGQCWASLDAATRSANPGTESDFRLLGTSDCDPFGRAQRQIPADGDLTTLQNVVDSHYFGTSMETTVHGVRGPLGTSNDSTVASLRDGLNRLVTVDTVRGGACMNGGVPTGRPCSVSFPCNAGETCANTTFDAADAFYEYDAADRLVQVRLTDNLSQNQIRRFGYDALGQTAWQENPENGTIVFKRYDALGNLLEVQFANGNARRTGYDFAGRVASVGYGMPGGSIVTTTLFYYDRNDAASPFGMGKASFTNAWEITSGGTLRQVIGDERLYNGLGGRLSRLNTTFYDWAANLTVATDYTYSSRGEVATVIYPRTTPTAGQDPLTVTYGYRNGMPVCASRGDCGATDANWLGKVQYNAAGGVEIVDMPGGGRTQITTTPRDRNRPITITGGTIANWAGAPYKDGPYKYDAAGNVYEIGHTSGADRFQYDTLNRLIGAHTEYSGAVIDETYTYDVFGNITRHVLQTLGGATETEDFALVSPVNNRLVSSTSTFTMGYNSTVSPAVPFVYDANGNLREGGRRINPGVVVEDVKKYTYDAMDHLVNVQKIGDTSTGLSLSNIDRFAYDVSGNRVVRNAKGDQTMFSVRDVSGQVLSEFRMPSSYGPATPREWAADYVYLAGRLLTMRENLRPQTPAGLTATQVKTPSGCTTNCQWLVTLSWSPNTDADIASYKVYRQIGGAGGFTQVGSSTTSSTLNDSTQHNPNVTLDYEVTAVDQQLNESLPSSPLRVMTGDVAGPTAPTLAATAADSSVWLSWTGGTDSSGIIGFEICRHETTSSPCVPVNTTLIRTTSYYDVNLVNGRTYYYKVRARDANLTWGSYSCRTKNACDTQATPTDRTPPAPPKKVFAASTCGGVSPEAVDVSWDANQPVPPYTLSYEVFRATTPLFEGIGASPTSLGSTTTTTFRDPGPLTPGTNYYYAVKAKHLSGGGSQVATTSAFSAIVSATTRDATSAPQGRLIAAAKDGEVNLRWQPPGGITAAPSYKVYRKANAEGACANYIQVAQGAYSDLVADAGITDAGVQNNQGYDYALVSVAANGVESSFGATTLAIPLDRPRGFSQCRMWRDPFCVFNCSMPALRINWLPPEARFYQPYLATTADGTFGFLKGYHLYHHKTCGVPYNIDGFDYLEDKSPTRPVLVNSGDATDPYLINKNLSAFDARDELLDPRYILATETQLSTPEGTTSDQFFWQSCEVALGGTMILNACAAPRAVYDIFAEGTWLSRESDWPDYFDHANPEPWQRCGETLADVYGMVPNTTPPTVSRDVGAGGGFVLSSGKTITYWIEERAKSPTGIILDRNTTTTQTVTLTGDGTLDKPRIFRPAVVNSGNATHWALYATAANGTFPNGNEVGEQLIQGTYIDDTRIANDPGLPDGFPYGAGPLVPFCTDVGKPHAAYARPVRKVEATALGPGSVRLDWVPPVIPQGEPRIAGFYLYGRRNYGNSKQTFKSPLPFATVGPSETSVTITGMGGGNLFDRDVFTVKSFDEAGRVSGDLYRCRTSGQDCGDTQSCTAQVCSLSGRSCNAGATPTGCAAGYCQYSGAGCTSDAGCSTYACVNNGGPCTPVSRARRQVTTAATGGAASITATLASLPLYTNHLILTVGVRSTSATTPVRNLAGGGASEWFLGGSHRQADGVWVEVWYGRVNSPPQTSVTVYFQTGTTPKASMVLAEYGGLPDGNIAEVAFKNAAANASTAMVADNSVRSPFRLVIAGFANVGTATYSDATNGYVEATNDIASTGGQDSTKNNTVMLEKWITVDPLTLELTTTLSAPASYAAVLLSFDSTSYICGGAGSGYECVHQYCTLDTCQTEQCEVAGGRWCSNDRSLECNVASDCGAGYCAGHCSKTITQTCDPNPSMCSGPTTCPTGEVCAAGASCLSYGNSATIATPGSGLVPTSLRTVVWTLNDALTTQRGRNGIKLAWTRDPGPGLTGYRVYRATDPEGPYCALLDGTGIRNAPLPVGVALCTSDVVGRTVDMDALSAEVSALDNSTGDRLETYWDQSAQTGRVYYYRVSTISPGFGGSLTESAMSENAAGQVLPYEPQVPPPPQGLRAWAAHNGTVDDQRGVHLNWCGVPTASANSADFASFPVPTEYRVYRKQLLPGARYQLLARFNPSCLAAGSRCEVNTTNDCSNDDLSTCQVLDPLPGACGGSGQPLCGILDHTFGCWPSLDKPGQTDYNYSYFVTSVAGPNPGVESMPSNFNEAWLNYCAGGGAHCIALSSCRARRDPDGDGQFLVCGDENARLWNEPDVDFCANPGADTQLASSGDSPAGEPLATALAPYRVIGQSPPSGNPAFRFVFYHLDHLGTPRLILDENGATVSQHHYLPFGEERPVPASSEPTLNRRAFTGHERDVESGLDYMMARYYGSTLARFMSPDPLGGDVNDPQSLNRYSYARNNPLMLTDPTGLYTCRDSNNCSSDKDKQFEASRQKALTSNDPDVARAAKAYGDPTKDNGVNVGFADLSKQGEGGKTNSHLGSADGDLQAKSEVTIDSKISGTEFDAAVGHEGSHVADAQDLVNSIKTDPKTGGFTVGQDITQYQSEKRAYGVTDSIYRSAHPPQSFRRSCGTGGDCVLGAGIIKGKVPSEIDRLLAYPGTGYTSSGKPLSPTNQGGPVVPH